MSRPTRPFTVEIKQKRGSQKRRRSIWGDIDLSAAMTETTSEFRELGLQSWDVIDSSVAALDAAHLRQPGTEHLMSNPFDAESVAAATAPASRVETPGTKTKTSRSRKPKAEPLPLARKKGASTESPAKEAAVPEGRKVHSQEERAQKLDQIAKAIGGGATLKSAVKEVGISEQTYYHWRKAAAPSAASDELTDLLALEKENRQLKSLLAERLRKENAELKRKLGLQ